MVVLKLIPRILSPELLSVLARMGHGDEIGEGGEVYIHSCLEHCYAEGCLIIPSCIYMIQMGAI